MTAIASSAAAPIDRRDLINAILELPEKDFWDLIDTRLNRPKGLRRFPGQGYLEITDANDKPSIVVRWSEQCLIDALFLELATTKSLVSHNGRCGIIIHKYYNQALALYKRISIARPAPKFVVDRSEAVLIHLCQFAKLQFLLLMVLHLYA